MTVAVFCRGYPHGVFEGMRKGLSVTEAHTQCDGQDTPFGITQLFLGTFHGLVDQVLF